MSDYIKRDDARRFLFDRLIETANNNTGYQCDSGIVYQDAAERIRLCWIDELPAVDVVERKHGEWIRVTEELGESWMCSECMEEFIPHDGMEEFASYAHFCPNCGAEMESADDV